MKLFTTLAALAFCTSSFVSAWSCLSDDDAQDIVNKSIIFLQHEDPEEARAIAYELFAPNITQYGDSINYLRGAPLGTPVYENATAYIEGTLSAPGIPEITQLALVHDCNSLIFFWEFNGIGGPMGAGLRVRGISYQQVDDNNKVVSHNVEFNSLAWAENTGFTIEYPTTGTYADAGPDAEGGEAKRGIAFRG
ncbi:uncharacterized protein HMPREF1541_05181 [Cyphellophora europaea CBS 101466]|uniref:NTF2-like domain-containing protein n=1 Tax=Cyphellophora europaea (strain CBS 101466) TaxID=1220924 RepID=W2RWQ2_CYPE1|nr:uncharacterized protein HMPREF1541_05181 [Cyphellophora europaea CBS 101466]ETN40901.1 hypothetical protein HMPREF1541_05181 [Cyphellophora europaea CBS 101466]